MLCSAVRSPDGDVFDAASLALYSRKLGRTRQRLHGRVHGRVHGKPEVWSLIKSDKLVYFCCREFAVIPDLDIVGRILWNGFGNFPEKSALVARFLGS